MIFYKIPIASTMSQIKYQTELPISNPISSINPSDDMENTKKKIIPRAFQSKHSIEYIANTTLTIDTTSSINI